MGKSYVENSLKRFLKRKVKITLGLVVAFMITGTVSLGAETEIKHEEHKNQVEWEQVAEAEKYLTSTKDKFEGNISGNYIKIENSGNKISYDIIKSLFNKNFTSTSITFEKEKISDETLKNIDSTLKILDTNFNQKFSDNEVKNIGIINNVSTASALEVGNLMKQHMHARQIIKTIKENYEMSYQFIESKQKTEAILTVCATGFGSAKKIGELLKNSLPKSIPLEIIPYDYQSLVTHGIEDNIFSEYDVKMLIGTLDPKVPGVKYMPMENIVTNDEVHYLHELIGKYLSDDELKMFNENVAKNFTLDNIVNHLTILNPQKVMEDVEEIVSELEKLFKCSLDITTKVGVYVHLSCLIERLILRQGITESEGMEDFAKKYPDLIENIKNIFSGVEYRYSVEIPIPEIRYLLNYFNFDE